MPSAEAILASATAIANEWRSVAAGWHAVLAALVTAAFCGWRPSNRVAGYVLSAPLLSVAVAAWLWANPFTATVFAAVFLFLVAIAHRLPRQPVQFSTPVMTAIGASLAALGWVYPHFLETNHWITYGYAAPLGVLPCPTLSAVIGATLMSGLLRSAAWSMTLATAGVVYGAIGVFVLGVGLDYALLAGALLLIGGAVRTPVSSGRTPVTLSSPHPTR